MRGFAWLATLLWALVVGCAHGESVSQSKDQGFQDGLDGGADGGGADGVVDMKGDQQLLPDAGLPPCPAPPCLDPTFAKGGLLQINTGIVSDPGFYANAVVVQPDNKIAFAGKAETAGNADFVIGRVNSAGMLDSSFGNNGITRVDFGDSQEEAHSITLRADKKLTVVGEVGDDGGVVRLNSDGSVDTSFGPNKTGKVVAKLSWASPVSFNGHVLLSQNALVIGGQGRFSAGKGNFNFLLVRVLENGALDTSFGTGGYAGLDFVGKNEFASTPVVQSNGSILLSGSSDQGNATSPDCAVIRVLANGKLDTTFDGDGRVVAHVGQAANGCPALALYPDGRIVVGGYSLDSQGQAAPTLTRYLSNGGLDTTFGVGGHVVTTLGTGGGINSIVVHPQGYIIAAGVVDDGGDADVALIAVMEDGQLRAAFGDKGTWVHDAVPGQDDVVFYGLLDSSGRLLLFGRTSSPSGTDLMVLRVLL